jgi:protein SCO1/2
MFFKLIKRTFLLDGRVLRIINTALMACLFSLNCGAGEVISGEFELTDHTGKVVTKASYNNQIRLVFFGFTRCPIICPATMAEVSNVMKMLKGRAGQVQVIFISIDPENDTTETVADYVSLFHPSVVGLTGTTEQIKKAAEAFNVTYGKGPVNNAVGSEEIFHTSYLYLMDRKGNLLDVIGYGTRPEIILEKLEEYL